MPRTDRPAPTASTCRSPVYGTSLSSPIWDSTTAMTTASSRKPTRQDRIGGDEAAEERPDRGGDRGRRADQRVRLLLRRSLEVAVDQRLHRRQQQRGAEAADDRPEDDDRGQALGERHRQRADRVRQQTQHVRPLASEQVADLAADQDERGGDQGLERDRALDRAHRRVEVLDDRGDRHVHQRRVDDEHEHRRRQHERQPRAPLRFDGCPASAQAAANSAEKNSSAVRVLVCCSPERSMPCSVRKTRASVATWNASSGRHLVESSKMRAPSG